MKKTNKCTWIYECNFIAQQSHHVLATHVAHHQDGEKKNTNMINMCQNHSTV